MTVEAEDEQFGHLQDALGQMILIKTYTQVTLFFASDEDPVKSDILNHLKDGLARLAKDFRWLTGQLVIRGKGEGNTGIAKIVPCEETISFIVNDLRDESAMPDMSSLREAHFPMRMLDRSLIAPEAAIPETFDENRGYPVRVFVVQANLIKGGILLNFAGNHHAMDMNGMGKVISLFSKACRQEPFTQSEIRMGNCSRKELIPLFDDDYQPGTEMDRFIAKATPSGDTATETNANTVPVSWAYLDFAAEDLKKLKARASKQKDVPFISTNDALNALLWQTIVRVRSLRSPALANTIAFRSMDARKLFNVSEDYPGHMVTGALETTNNVHLLPLEEVASKLRKGVESPGLIWQTRALATLLDREADKSKISYAASIDITKDILFSSWAKVPCYRCDFGRGLGQPECVRRARFAPMESVVYFMPMSREGSIAVALCLRDDDLEMLKKDQDLMTYAKYIG